MDSLESSPAWSEANSQQFIDYGRYFVPAREQQIELLCNLVPPAGGTMQFLELCCGEGLLAEALLEHFPQARLTGYDGSPRMLGRAVTRLERFQDRFSAREFDLAQTDWRDGIAQYQAVVSSLAIHHLDAAAKQALYSDAWQMLLPGGAFLIADLVLPLGEQALAVAADEWDAAVRQRALELDGTLEAYEFFTREGWNYFRYPDAMDMPSPLSDHLRWLEAAGYQELNVFWTHAGHAIWGGRRPSDL